MKNPKNKDAADSEWVVPASIPFSELKGRDLEECVYWLFDAMGAKDLEWRTGGSGGGAADGGRDLEAHFFTPSVDDELEPQIWWVECKGRAGTVEKSEVQEAVNNSLAKDKLDYLVIATNTQFSNPTRDWVRDWQKKHKLPRVKLWDSGHLERMLSKHPSVVLRLFSDALSVEGRLRAMESRFWNRLEYSQPGLLERVWHDRERIEFSQMGLFAAIASEFSSGDITRRPWGVTFKPTSVLGVLCLALANTPYLVIRSTRLGVDQTPLIRSVSYLIMCMLREFDAKSVSVLIMDSVITHENEKMPRNVQEYLLMPIIDQLLSELQEICSDDCDRMSTTRHPRLTQSHDEIDSYWRRFEEASNKIDKVEENEKWLLIEKEDAPCKVGFLTNKERSCPLFRIEPNVDNLNEVLEIAKRVIEARFQLAKN